MVVVPPVAIEPKHPYGYMILLEKNGAPEEIRTPDPQIRSLVLYPAELRAPLASRRISGATPKAQPRSRR